MAGQRSPGLSRGSGRPGRGGRGYGEEPLQPRVPRAACVGAAHTQATAPHDGCSLTSELARGGCSGPVCKRKEASGPEGAAARGSGKDKAVNKRSIVRSKEFYLSQTEEEPGSPLPDDVEKLLRRSRGSAQLSILYLIRTKEH